MPMEEKKVLCSCGFEVSFDPDVTDDVELLELLIDFDANRLDLTPKIAKALLGEEQYAALKAYLKKTEGKARITRVSEVIVEALNGNAKKKPPDPGDAGEPVR